MEPAFFVEMSCCGAVYELDPEVGKRLLRGEEVEITERDLTLRQDGNGNPWTGSDASHRHKVCPSCGFETMRIFRTVQSAANRCKAGKYRRIPLKE